MIFRKTCIRISKLTGISSFIWSPAVVTSMLYYILQLWGSESEQRTLSMLVKHSVNELHLQLSMLIFFIYLWSLAYIHLKIFYIILSQNSKCIFYFLQLTIEREDLPLFCTPSFFSLGEHCFHISVHFSTFKECANKDALLRMTWKGQLVLLN